jgi:diguanylate cyclase (GGDEF)-like protein
VQRWLGKPLNQLGDYVRRLTIDNLGEQPFVLAGRSRHELHYLADVLNEMVRNLRGSVDKNAALYRALELEQAALRELNEHLEQRVAERTADLQDANRKLAELSITDGLTGLTNRRHFDASFADEYGRAQRGGHALALIMLDVDYFKPFNDQYGHQAGDDCLQMLARTLMENARRPSDLVARYGGEEFIVLTTETDISRARHLAESICQAVAAMNIAHVQSPWGTVTVSVGMAIRVVDGSWKPQDLLRMADQALYRAKERGRNRVECLADGDLR